MNTQLEKSDPLLEDGSVQYTTAATLTAYYLKKGRYPAKTDLPGCEYLLSYWKYLQIFGSWGLAKNAADILLSTIDPSSITGSVFGIKGDKDKGDILEEDLLSVDIDPLLEDGSVLLKDALLSKEYVSYKYYTKISFEERLQYIEEHTSKIELHRIHKTIEQGLPKEIVIEQTFDDLIFELYQS